jgi:hypothetical protein
VQPPLCGSGHRTLGTNEQIPAVQSVGPRSVAFFLQHRFRLLPLRFSRTIFASVHPIRKSAVLLTIGVDLAEVAAVLMLKDVCVMC